MAFCAVVLHRRDCSLHLLTYLLFSFFLSYLLTYLLIYVLTYYRWVCRSSEAEASAEPTTEAVSMEDQEVGGKPGLEAEPPLITSAHGLSFWMFIVVRLSRIFSFLTVLQGANLGGH